MLVPIFIPNKPSNICDTQTEKLYPIFFLSMDQFHWNLSQSKTINLHHLDESSFFKKSFCLISCEGKRLGCWRKMGNIWIWNEDTFTMHKLHKVQSLSPSLGKIHPQFSNIRSLLAPKLQDAKLPWHQNWFQTILIHSTNIYWAHILSAEDPAFMRP